MRTSVDTQFEALDVAAEALLQPQYEFLQLRLGLSHGVIAQRLAGAPDAPAADAVDIQRKTDLRYAVNHFIHALFGNIGDDEVLLARQADVATEFRGEIRNLDRLLTGDLAQEGRESDVVQPVGLLRMRSQVIDRTDRLWNFLERLEWTPELLFDRLAHSVRTIVVDHELHACLGSRKSIPQVRAPDVEDHFGYDQRILLRNEHVEITCNPRRGRQATADAQ